MSSDNFLTQRIEELENELKDVEKRSEMIKESLIAYKKVQELELKRTGEEIPKKYKGVKIKQAVFEVINEAGIALRTKEVFQKLKEGGAEIGGKESSQLPYVYTCLMRLKKEGKIKKIGKSKWSK